MSQQLNYRLGFRTKIIVTIINLQLKQLFGMSEISLYLVTVIAIYIP